MNVTETFKATEEALAELETRKEAWTAEARAKFEELKAKFEELKGTQAVVE